jgi:hypothetical protein
MNMGVYVVDGQRFAANRKKILAKMKKWGYDPNSVLRTVITEESYMRIVLDKEGKRYYGENGRDAVREVTQWKKRKHGEWLIQKAFRPITLAEIDTHHLIR